MTQQISKGLAVYFYPELNREIIVVGIFLSEKDVEIGQPPLYYTVWDEDGRLDKYDVDTWETLPTREEIKKHYIELL